MDFHFKDGKIRLFPFVKFAGIKTVKGSPVISGGKYIYSGLYLITIVRYLYSILTRCNIKRLLTCNNNPLVIHRQYNCHTLNNKYFYCWYFKHNLMIIHLLILILLMQDFYPWWRTFILWLNIILLLIHTFILCVYIILLPPMYIFKTSFT